MAVDPAAMPFAAPAAVADQDPGLDADIIRPATLSDRLKTQEAVPLGCVLDLLCLTEDGRHAIVAGRDSGRVVVFGIDGATGDLKALSEHPTGERVLFVLPTALSP